jgi:uncharacterized membrane protein YjjB (DUF3815 family)
MLATGISSLSDASKSVSSFGISIGLGLLGVVLAKKYRKSRFIVELAAGQATKGSVGSSTQSSSS